MNASPGMAWVSGVSVGNRWNCEETRLWVRRKKAGLKLICSGCGQHVPASRIQEICERQVRPCFSD